MVIHCLGVGHPGPFPQVVGGYRYLYVAIDKFTKWPQVTPMVKINKQSTIKFIKSIICKFSIPNKIITDNRSQFTSSNCQVERANTEILKDLKTRTYDALEKHGKKWIVELPSALWGNRTSPSQATRETPFFMVYGAEVVLPSKVTMGSLHIQAYYEAAQDQLWCKDIKNARYRQALKRYQERSVRSRELQVDDLVLWWVLTQEGANKLSPGWEGPFHVTQVCRLGCVRLATEDGEPLHNPWNIEHLRKFYP
jgi:hypothetical protein